MENPFKIMNDERNAIIDLSIKSCSREIKHIVAMEELAECSQEVSKFARNEGDELGLVEEIADIILSLEMINKMNGITKDQITQAINVKLDREHQRHTKPNEPIILTSDFESELSLSLKDKMLNYIPCGNLATTIEPGMVIQSSRYINSKDFGSYYGYDVKGSLTINGKEIPVTIISMKNPSGNDVKHYVIEENDEVARNDLIRKYFLYRPYTNWR